MADGEGPRRPPALGCSHLRNLQGRGLELAPLVAEKPSPATSSWKNGPRSSEGLAGSQRPPRRRKDVPRSPAARRGNGRTGISQFVRCTGCAEGHPAARSPIARGGDACAGPPPREHATTAQTAQPEELQGEREAAEHTATTATSKGAVAPELARDQLDTSGFLVLTSRPIGRPHSAFRAPQRS